MPKTEEVIERSPFKYEELKFQIHNLLEAEKEKDIKDLIGLLKQTHV